MTKLALAIILLLTIIPLASAFPCHLTADESYCLDTVSSDLNESEKDEIFSALFYSNSTYPDHSFMDDYNTGIEVLEPPHNTTINNSRTIRNAWISFLTLFPSVYENNTLYVTPESTCISEFDYDVYIPPNYYSRGYPETNAGDCQRTYSLIENRAVIDYYLNDIFKATDKTAIVNTDSDGELKSEVEINTNLEVRHWHWYSYCCRWYKGSCKRYCHECRYSHTSYQPDSMTLSEEKNITVYDKIPQSNVTILSQYYNTTKREYSANNYSYFQLGFNSSYLILRNYYYNIIFDKKPYYFAYLQANNYSSQRQRNIIVSNNTFFVKNSDNCTLRSMNHFYSDEQTCDMTITGEEIEPLTKETKELDLKFLFYIVVFLIIMYVIYKLFKSQGKKIAFIPIIIFLLIMPVTIADDCDDECGLTNLSSCIPQKFYEYFLVFINAPLLPLLVSVQELLTADISIEIFHHVWNVIRYILSFFYIFFFIYAGSIFLTSSSNPVKRSQAKDMLKDTVIMIVLIQASFYIYELVLDISTIMDVSILGMIDPHFFILTSDHILNAALEVILYSSYAIVLFLTVLMLVLRYIIVSFGVVLFPIGLFLYFIPPLKGYGKFILSVLGIFIFVTFIDLLIILACSMLITAPLFASIKMLLMINCFGIVNYTLYLAIKFALKNSSISTLKDDIGQAAKYIALLA